MTEETEVLKQKKTRLTLVALPILALTVMALTASCTTSSKKNTTTQTPTASATATCGGDGNLCVVAGEVGFTADAGDGGPATQAYLYWPQDMWVASDGTLYILDWNNHKVKYVDSSGNIHTWAGTFVGDTPCQPGVTRFNVLLNHPTDFQISPTNSYLNGSYVITAWHDQNIRAFDATGNATCVCGNGVGAFSGDGGPATAAQVNFPSSSVWDGIGNQYLSDQNNERVRKIDTAGIITTFAGNGTQGYVNGVSTTAIFNWPKGSNAWPAGKLAINGAKTVLYVADTLNDVIRKIDLSSQTVTTIAGTAPVAGTPQPGYTGDGGPATSATLYYPQDVAVGPDGSTIYVADTYNHVIRRFTEGGNITTVAGTGVQGSSPNGTPAKQAQLNKPGGVWVDGNNTLYIADTYNSVIRKVHNP